MRTNDGDRSSMLPLRSPQSAPTGSIGTRDRGADEEKRSFGTPPDKRRYHDVA
jgi:hypothetical protein